MYKNLVGQVGTTRAECFCNIRDFLCALNGTYNDYSATGTGWVVHDASYAVDADNPAANDYVVIKSTGENTTERLYFKISLTSTSITFLGYLYWDNTTHSGTRGYGGYNSITLGTDIHKIWLYADLDFVSVISKYTSAAYYYNVNFGKIREPAFDHTIATSSEAIPAGTDIVVTVDAVPSSWKVGGRVLLRDLSNIYRPSITAISGNTVTFDVIGGNLDAATILSVDATYVCGVLQHGNAMFTHDGLYNSYGMACSSFSTYNYGDNLSGSHFLPCTVFIAANYYMGKDQKMCKPQGVLTGVVSEDALTDTNSNQWRFFQYSAAGTHYTLFREV